MHSDPGIRGLLEYRDGKRKRGHGQMLPCYLTDSAIITQSLPLATVMLKQTQEGFHGSSILFHALPTGYRGSLRGAYDLRGSCYRISDFADTALGIGSAGYVKI